MDIKHIVEQSKASIEKEDLELLLRLLIQLDPKTIVEIGTWKAYSARVWLDAFNPQKFYTIDKSYVGTDAWLGKKGCDSKYIIGDSHNSAIGIDLATFLNNGSIDFLFIDGDHSYEGVKKDWEMYSPLVRRGGIVALHDCCYHHDKTEEVDIFWKELKQKYNYVEIKSSQTSTGMGIIFL